MLKNAATTELLCIEAETLRTEPTSNPPSLTHPDHTAYVICTSGSTGRPKGCIVPHYQVVRLFEATETWYGSRAPMGAWRVSSAGLIFCTSLRPISRQGGFA
jgi:non-ribosomal peptide synthetase component F